MQSNRIESEFSLSIDLLNAPGNLQVSRKELLNGCLDKLIRYRFFVVAFAIPLGIRALPEILAGPYPIGYDTIASYVPLMLDWGSGNLRGFSPLIGGWLIFGVLGMMYSATRIDPILIAKAAGPVLYGILGVAEYFFARRSLGWEPKKCLLFLVITSFYFVSLRVSLDLFRNTLGTALLLLALAVGRDVKTPRNAIIFASLAWLVTATHLLVATLLFGMIFIETVASPTQFRKVLLAIPGIAQYTVSLIGLTLGGVTTFSNGELTIPSVTPYVYLAYIFLPIIPMAALGFRRVRAPSLVQWLFVCGIGFVASTSSLALSVQLVSPDRWALMMIIPLGAYACSGISRWTWRNHQRFRFPSTIFPAWIMIVLVMGLTFMILPASQAFPYYRYFEPTSMEQSTIPAQDSPNVINAIEWLSSNIRPSDGFMAHHAIYGWAREYFRASNPLIWYYPGTTLNEALQATIQLGYTRIYTVWWANGQGWYGQPSVPPGFLLVQRFGDFGVFLYTK